MRNLILVVAALLLPAMAFATAPPPSGIILDADFDDLSSGTSMDGMMGYGGAYEWGCWNHSLQWLAIADPTGSGMGNVLAFDGSAHYFCDLLSSPWGDPYDVETNGKTTVYEFDIYYASPVPGEAMHTFIHTLGYIYDDEYLGRTTDVWEVFDPAPVSAIGNADTYANVWNHVEVVIDHQTDTFDYILNGTTVVNDHPYGISAFPKDIGWLDWDVDAEPGYEGDYQVLMDNMKITYTAIPEPGVLLLGGLGLAALLRRRK